MSLPMERRPTLNFDTLHHVVSSIDTRKDLSFLMKTCRAIYLMGIPALFRIPVFLSTLPEVESFCNFMLANHSLSNLDRFQFFKDVVITTSFEDSDQARLTAELLCATISKSSSLVRISFSSNAEEILSATPGMLSAFACLPSIKIIQLSG